MTSSPAVVIARRFVGPPSSGNGGYTAGLLAEHVPHAPDQTVTVTLRRPPPIDTSLQVVTPSSTRTQDAATLLMDGDTVVAEAAVGAFAADAVASVSPAEALAAESSYAGLHNHPFPTCFVCGTDRAAGDGLRLAPGPLAAGMTACMWTPHPSLADETGQVAVPFVWAALDCPSAWTSDLEARPVVLGQMTARCHSAPLAAAQYVIVARLLSEQGRKTLTASALYDADGGLVARAEHVWIAIDPADFA